MNVYHMPLRAGECVVTQLLCCVRLFVDTGRWPTRSDMLRAKRFLQRTPTENKTVWCASGSHAAQEVEILCILEEMSGKWVKGLSWEWFLRILKDDAVKVLHSICQQYTQQ